MPTLSFIDVPRCDASLGWRFDSVLSQEAADSLTAHLGDYDFRHELFSPSRKVAIEPFSISAEPILWTELCKDHEKVEAADSLRAICSQLNAQLEPQGLRLPTEDELEIAIGGSLFAWGDTIPDGIPYSDYTEFEGHKQPNPRGILFNADTYSTELVDGYLKMGDGGVTVCGGEPWPMAWLSLSPAFRVPSEMYESCLPEYLETALIHPVRAV